MKGLIFTEFIEMVEQEMGYEMVHHIITDSHLPSEGIYTAVGTYPETEMVQLLTQLSKHTKTEIPELLFSFGKHLFSRFSVLYAHFFEGKTTAFELLENIEDYIHVEVLKLYPDAALPTIDIIKQDDSNMQLIYRSPRKLSQFALGLMTGCSEHYKEEIDISEIKNIEDGSEVWFQLSKK